MEINHFHFSNNVYSISVFLFTRGLNLSVEFTGGTLMEVQYSQAANVDQIRG